MLRFDDIFIDYTRLGRKIPKEKYLQKGKHIIIDQGQNDIAGYSNEEDGIFSDIPVIIFGDHTRIFKLIKSPFFLGADGTKILKAKISNMSYDYLYYYLKYKKIPNTGYNRHFKWLKELTFEIKDFNEQEKISTVLNKVSKILKMKKQQLSELDRLIKFQFLKIFGDPILNEKNWKNAVWKNILIIKNGKNQKQVENIQGIYPIYGSGGIIGYADEYLCEKNTVIIGRKGNINKPILVKTKFWNVDTAFGLEPIKKVLNSYFLYYFCIFYNFEKHNKAVTIPSLTKNDLLEIKMPLPPIELQNKFADFVKQVDKSKVILEKALKSLSFGLNYYYML